MVTLLLTHEVKNIPERKEVYDAGEPLRQQAGVKVNGVYTSTDNPNYVTIIAEAQNVEAVHGFMTHPDLKVYMEKAGVIGMPEFKILIKNN